jgi:hypothetical protein
MPIASCRGSFISNLVPGYARASLPTLLIYRCGTDPRRNACSGSHIALYSLPGFISDFERRSLWLLYDMWRWQSECEPVASWAYVHDHLFTQGDSPCCLLLLVKEALEQFSLRFTAKACGLRNTYGSVPMCETSQPPVGKHSTLLRHANNHCSWQ